MQSPLLSIVGDSDNSILAIAETHINDLWDDFLRLQISAATKRTYGAAIDNFFVLISGSSSTPRKIAEFLGLNQHQAIAIVLKYKADLLALKLSPATINVRLSAIRSLVNHARKLGKCNFNLGDIPRVKSQAYRDTSGVKPIVFKAMLDGIDRDASGGSVRIMGIRDYAILRLLWDNALRCGELASLTIGDFENPKLWIQGKGRTQKESIDLSPLTIAALDSWLSVRGTADQSAAMFIALDPCYAGMQLSPRSIDRLLKKAATKAQVTKVLSPHRIRHSSITAALDASNGDVRRVQKLSRHKNIATLMIYDDNRSDAQSEISVMLSHLV